MKKVQKVKIQRYYGSSVIGGCLTCGKPFVDYQKPQQAYNHARQTGHQTRVEKSVVFHYN